jgi:phage FluMu protein Com
MTAAPPRGGRRPDKHADLRATALAALPEWRCARCGRLLARLLLLPGCRGAIKCERCGALNEVDVKPATV